MESVRKRITQSIAVGGVALVMCVVTVLFVQRTAIVPQPSLADRLPGSGTMLFFRGSSQEELATVNRLLGLEKKLTTPLPLLGSGSYELAVVSNGGAWQWVLQRTTSQDTELSGPAVGALIADSADHSGALNRTTSFRRMTKQAAPAIWMRSDALTLGDTHADAFLGAMLAPYSHVQIEWGSNRTLVLLRRERQSLASRPAGPIGLAPGSTLDILDPALAQRIQTTLETLRAESPLLQEGLAGIFNYAWRHEWNGSPESFPEFLSHLAGIRVQRGSGDTLSYAFALQGMDATRTAELLESFAAGLPQTQVRNLELKKNDRTDILVDENAVQRGEETVLGWKLRWVAANDGNEALGSAERGTRTLLSTNLTLLRSMIAETAPVTQATASAAPTGALQAGGRLDTTLLEEVLSSTLPIFAKERNSLFWQLLDAAGDVRWTSSALLDADILTIEEGQ